MSHVPAVIDKANKTCSQKNYKKNYIRVITRHCFFNWRKEERKRVGVTKENKRLGKALTRKEKKRRGRTVDQYATRVPVSSSPFAIAPFHAG